MSAEVSPDANETYRGCIVTNPIASGDVLVRCPSHLALALPPSPPNPFQTSSQTRCGTILPARDVGLRISEWRSSSFVNVCWAMPLAGNRTSVSCRSRLISLGMWTDEQLVELHSPRLRAAAEDQRQENRAAFEALAAAGPRYGCASFTNDDVTWALNTVRSRSFPGEYPTTGSAHQTALPTRP